jgi:hypothetical protein
MPTGATLGIEWRTTHDGRAMPEENSRVPHAMRQYVVEWELAHRDLGTVRVIGVDEFGMRKGASI